MDLQTLGDRLEINDLLTRYAHSVDSKDWTLYRSVFTEDAFIDAAPQRPLARGAVISTARPRT